MQTIRNESTNTQWVLDGDKRRWEIAPLTIATYKDEIAERFLKERGDFVLSYGEERQSYVDPNEDTIWIANNSGNPFLPELMQRFVIRKGEEITEEFKNPIRTPKIIREYINLGQKTVQVDASGIGGDPNEYTQLNFPPRLYEIFPYERKPFAYSIGQRMLEMDGFREEEWQGSVAACRAPAIFEPNDSWAYDDLRLYALMVDPDVLGALLTADDSPFPKEAAFTGLDKGSKLNNCRVDLLHHLFFRLIDKRFRLPSEEDFNAEKKKLGKGK